MQEYLCGRRLFMAAALQFRHCSFEMPAGVLFAEKGRGCAKAVACVLFFCFFARLSGPEEKGYLGDERRVLSTTNPTYFQSAAKVVLSIIIAAVATVEIKNLIRTSQWLNHSNTVLRPSLLPLKVRSGEVVIL